MAGTASVGGTRKVRRHVLATPDSRAQKQPRIDPRRAVARLPYSEYTRGDQGGPAFDRSLPPTGEPRHEDRLMPTPSKFNRRTAALVVELLVAGCSRREVARRVGIHHSQIARWVARGDKVAGSGSRFADFAEACHLAETDTPPILVALRDEQERMLGDPDLAWKFIQEREPGFARRPDPEPIQIEVVYSVPVKEGDPA
jgi:transposase-like protein